MSLSHVLLIVILFFSLPSMAQKAELSGEVADKKTGEPLIGVNVLVDGSGKTTTNFNGEYSVNLSPGSHKITFKYIGYKTTNKQVSVQEEERKTLDIALSEETEQLNTVVVSASKYKKKLSEETVSMDVLESEQIENSNSIDAEEAMQKVPGVTITEGQANIRGGSGWSYGAGSRVLLLTDGVPLMTAHAADVKWDLIPVENVKQIEVIKGAASALYGSSALNGVINIRTQWPGDTAYTKIVSWIGAYGNPPDQDLKWWNDGMKFTGNDWFQPGVNAYEGQPIFGGTRFVHRRKLNRFDVVIGGNYNGNKGFKEKSSRQLGRLNFKTRYRPRKFKGLSLGVNANLYRSWTENWFVWNGIDSMGYRPFPNSVSNLKTVKARVDPHLTYIAPKGHRYNVNLRYFNTTNKDNTNQGSRNNQYYGQFSFQKTLDKSGVNIITGASGYYSDVGPPKGVADEESLVGSHTGSNAAVFFQTDKKFFTRLNLSLGLRLEYFQIDTFRTDSELKLINGLLGTDITTPAKPVIRFGANYQLFEETYMRASFGQGYRFPTIAEKFVSTNIGGDVAIYPNPELESETGWSAEIGVKQGVQFAGWQGYADLAGFINQYDNMMEFTFGQFGNSQTDPLFGLGFSSQNVGNTRILGGELTLMGKGEILGAPTTLLAGYTYIEPRSLNWNDTLQLYDKNGEQIGTENTYKSYSSSDDNFLKYRYRHTLKVDVESQIQKFSVGAGIQFNSFMKNIDKPFVDRFVGFEGSVIDNTKAFSGLKEYRKNRDGQWDKKLNVRLGYQITDNVKGTFIVKNVLNDNYTIRPGLYGEPRNYTLQFKMEF